MRRIGVLSPLSPLQAASPPFEAFRKALRQDIAGKQLEVLKEAIPGLLRAGVLWRPSNPSYGNLLSRFDAVVRATGVEVVLVGVESRDDLVGAFETMKASRLGGVLVQADDLFMNEGAR